MRKLDKFLISKRPYAVDLTSLWTGRNTREDGTHFWSCSANAVWFRRRHGVTVACIGFLWDLQDSRPETVEEFVLAHDDGRYGGTAMGRWDGDRYWSDGVSLKVQGEHLDLLRPMLEHYPDVPAGYDGWWTFQPERRTS
jgi:hypothetical protein